MFVKKIKVGKTIINFLDFKPLKEKGLFLILHGWGSEARRWQIPAEIMEAKGYRVLVLDLPGFGKSSPPQECWGLEEYSDFIKNFTDNLGINNFFLIGHSFGGAIAVKYAIKYPEKVKKLFLVSPACFRKKTIKKMILYLCAKFFKIFCFLPGYKSFVKIFYKIFVRKSDYIYTEGIMRDIYLKIIKEDLTNFLPLVKVPTIVIWGAEDRIKKLKEGFKIANLIKGAKLVVIEKAHHSPYYENPEEFVKRIMKNL